VDDAGRLYNNARALWQLMPEAISFSATTLRSYRSIWISDFHLGTRRCQADVLLDFLRHHEADNLYLVGDIVDGWNLGASWYWSSAQQAVVGEIAEWRKRGARVELLSGNHDESNPDLVESLFGPVATRTELIHRTADGRRMLVTHGHQFDRPVASGRWLKRSQGYTMALRINEWYCRGGIDKSCWPASLSEYVRYRVKKAVQYFTDFDDRQVFEMARRHKVDGIICGHIHRAEQRLIGSLWYINDGDWVESCTALVEDYDGGLRLLQWDGLEETTGSRLTSLEMPW
jgi:UDP-2,3-diacylglucosamine pyrophosphatase LpxH